MNIFKKILIELAFIFRWKNKKYGDWFLEMHRELANEAIKRININKDNIIIK